MRQSVARLQLLVGSLLVSFVLVGCSFQYAMSVRNDTDRRYLIRNPIPNEPGHIQVSAVEPHGSNIAIMWNGNPSITVELLDSYCASLGVFESTDGKTFGVSSVPGVTLTLIEGIAPLTDFRNNGEVYSVEDCGGEVKR